MKQFPGIATYLEKPEVVDAIDRCKQAVLRAGITNLEALLCRSCLKSKQPLARVDTYVAQFSQEFEEDAATLIAPVLQQFISKLRATASST